jgi:uncharacterized Zn-binding protein involved in type VI secretion
VPFAVYSYFGSRFEENLMSGEIIRQGDRTSHGGTVIEGSLYDICMGKPIAFVGHKVICPKCKGVFPIAQGAPSTTFYGKGVALAGMKTACGATLIASQFSDTVECGGGEASAAASSPANGNGTVALTSQGALAPVDTSHKQFNEKFMLIDDATGDPLPHTEYAIRRACGEIEHGTTDANGCTHLLATTASAELIDIYV